MEDEGYASVDKAALLREYYVNNDISIICLKLDPFENFQLNF